jgi:phosphatidate cytidylyltransferase
MDPHMNFLWRLFVGIPMFIAFLCLSSLSIIWIVVLNISLSAIISYEILTSLPTTSTNTLQKLLYIYVSIIIHIKNILPSLPLSSNTGSNNTGSNTGFPILTEEALFVSYLIGIIVFVKSLKHKTLRLSLINFSVLHVIVYLLSRSASYAIRNASISRFYYFYPSLLVIVNDVFAYAVGKTIGSTSLYSLSPKKTVEGFIGGTLFTYLVGFFICYLKISHGFFPDKFNTLLSKPYDITTSACLNTRLTHWLGHWLGNESRSWIAHCPRIYWHNLLFSTYISFIAPYSGFIGSAIKRALGKKDFGHALPGHGGITDRMDCQIPVSFFTYFFIRLVLV